MKGDFSKAAAITAPNDLGVLFQQGRVISDRDLTEAELIAETWRETAARDVIGANVAAVPADEPDGYRVEAAAVHGTHVDVRLSPGRIWADGIHLTLPDAVGGGSPSFAATYLDPPANPPGIGVGDIADGLRDAVVLEISLGALNGFQEPERLIEPALGGPDTAERIHPRQHLRLLRLNPGEDCTTIGPRLRDDLATHGRLSVTLEPATEIPGDCPVVEGGGYSGFEHNLYRIEIAETSGAAAMFKWSSLNGGLVGRGRFIGGADPRVEITANRTAILNSGITEYYLEALEYAEHRGCWRVTYGTTATLNADGDIDLATPATFGTLPGAGGTVFFRLWNGIEPISAFTGGATPFRDGIELDFTSPAADYRPEDFWTFDLRAGEIENPETLFDDAPPEGPQLRRVPLAEVSWTGHADTDVSGEIEDCRRRFRPLSNQKLCCTYLVGNGLTSFGDFNSLEEAVAHLPAGGGQICLLPGIHLANLRLIDRFNVKIHGCRERTLVLPRMSGFADPVIRIEGGGEIEIADLDFFAPFGIAVDATGTIETALRGLGIRGCRVLSLTYGFRIEWAQRATVSDNRVWLLDHIFARSAMSIRGTDSLVEGNEFGVWPFEFKPPIPGGEDGGDPPDPADPCIEPEDLYGNLAAVVAYLLNAWLTIITAPPEQPYRARGGLHLRGSSERIDVIRNRIDGGSSHGIVLGGTYPDEVDAEEDPETGGAPESPTLTLEQTVVPGNAVDEAGDPVIGLVLTLTSATGAAVQTRISLPAKGQFVFTVPPGTYRLEVTPGYEVVSATLAAQGLLTVVVRRIAAPDRPDAGFLHQIRIIDNTIERMGLSGIGFLLHSLEPTAPLLPSAATPAALTEFLAELIAPRELIGTTNLIRDLEIRGNRIQDNLRIVFTDILIELATMVAQGGISLPLVEGLRITDNHIVRNGTSAANPSAGIFVGYGEEVILSGNYISGNGPLGEDYDTAGIEGLRGGVVVRMATAMISGGAEDAKQRSALDMRDNHIDQPAGRAITAFAFGPVSCVGNHLNSEREGRWSFIDRFAGAVLIANLAGLHRHFEPLGKSAFGLDDSNGRVIHGIGLAAKTSVESLLPGGEVMFNSNRVRTGGDNRAYSSQLIATCDDLGYDGNQSAIFKPELVFTNLTAVGMSVRVTDNRFRERSRSTAMSALSLSFGLGTAGRAYAMNIAVPNQADHCVIALSNGPPIGQDVLDTPNQVVFRQFCPVEPKAKATYLLAALVFLLLLESQPELDLEEAKKVTPGGVGMVVGNVGAFQDRMLNVKSVEAMRLERATDGRSIRGAELQAEMFRRREAADALDEQAKLAAVREAADPAEGGLVIDGRVTDARGYAVPGAEVELVDGRGRSLKIDATADKAGYYALTVPAEQKDQLAGIEGVAIRATFGKDETATVEAADLLRADPGKVRADIVTERLKDFRVNRLAFDTTVRRGNVLRDAVIRPVRPVRPGTAERPGNADRPTVPDQPAEPEVPDEPGPSAEPDRPAEPDQPTVPDEPTDGERPDEPTQPDTPRRTVPRGGAAALTTRLEGVRGVGRSIARRLREAGIEDARAIVDTPAERLREILGPRADAIRDAAAAVVRRAGGRREDD